MFYTDTQKQIYTAPDNKKYDPLAIYRKLILHSGAKINDHLADWRIVEDMGDKPDHQIIAHTAENELVRISRAAFDLKPFGDGTGDTDSRALEILIHYLEWLAKKD